MVNMFKDASKMKTFTAFGPIFQVPGSGSGFTAGNTQEGEDTNDDGLSAETELALNYVPSVFSGESELALATQLATIDLDYNFKYGFFASVRRDETSRFVKQSSRLFLGCSG